MRLRCISFQIVPFLPVGVAEILVDTETGVNYLVVSTGFGGGVTPLLDSNGKVVIDK